MTVHFRHFLMLSLLAALIAGCAGSQPDAQTDEPATAAVLEDGTATASEEPAVEDVVRQVADFYKGKQAIRVEDHGTAETRIAGMQNVVTMERSVAFERPNRLALRSQGGPVGLDIVSDGDRLTIYLPMTNAYTESEAPASSDQLLDDPALAMMATGGMFVLSLLSEDPYAKIMEDVAEARYGGRDALDGQDVHRLEFAQADMDWELWVDAGPEPVVHQVRVDASRAMADRLQQFGQDPTDASIVMTERFENWSFDEAWAPETFVFEAPEGAQKQDNLLGAMGMDEPEPAPPSLVGQAAPAVEFELLDGTAANLEDHVGQQVVLLDFWATWCPPCRRGMPVLADLATSYAERGVVVYAVNQGEDAETVEQYLQEEELELTVAMDPAGRIGSEFNVEVLPTLVLIDKQGIIQEVHRGLAPKDLLTQQLDQLLEQ